jgi:hypothetical protein
MGLLFPFLHEKQIPRTQTQGARNDNSQVAAAQFFLAHVPLTFIVGMSPSFATLNNCLPL